MKFETYETIPYDDEDMSTFVAVKWDLDDQKVKTRYAAEILKRPEVIKRGDYLAITSHGSVMVIPSHDIVRYTRKD